MASLNLLDSFGKRGVFYGLLAKPADIIDSDYASKYFVIAEMGQQLSAGRNGISFNGSVLLKPGSEILIECLDSAGQNLFVEMALSTNASARTYPYKESTGFTFPRYRFDQLMRLGWQFLIPLSIVNVMGIGVALVLHRQWGWSHWTAFPLTTLATLAVAGWLGWAGEKKDKEHVFVGET